MAKKQTSARKFTRKFTPNRRTATPKKGRPRSKKPKQGRPSADVVDWAPPFLNAIKDGVHVRDAAAAANVAPTMAYRRKKTDEPFRLAWEAAAEIGTKALEAEATRRAYHGTLKPVYQGGDLVGHVREYSDTLIMFLLRGRKPKKYRENHKVAVGGSGVHSEIVGIEVITQPARIAAPVPTGA